MKKSFCNASEVELVCGLLNLLKVRPEQVAIITFYKAQALELERALKVPRSREGCGFDRCIHTVDSFQGSEADVVLISFVRTERSGFLRDFRRLNVAVTWAKHLLLLVGNYSQLGRVTGRLLGSSQRPGCSQDASAQATGLHLGGADQGGVRPAGCCCGRCAPPPLPTRSAFIESSAMDHRGELTIVMSYDDGCAIATVDLKAWKRPCMLPYMQTIAAMHAALHVNPFPQVWWWK